MQKISAGRGHQRLLQLARSQLGHEFETKTATTDAVSASIVQNSDFNQRHQRLAQRSGAPVSADTGFKAPTLSQRAERRERMHKERQQSNLEK